MDTFVYLLPLWVLIVDFMREGANYKNTILVYEVKLDHIYPGKVRDPQQKAKAAHRQNNQLLPLKNVQKFLAKTVHDESHSHFHHGKLHRVHVNIL